MKIGLFVPCYIDQFYPRVAVATLELLERLGCDVEYPTGQTCCGQPMANAGSELEGDRAYRVFDDNFRGFDYVVGPSGSCVLHIREHVYGDSGLGAHGTVRDARGDAGLGAPEGTVPDACSDSGLGGRTYELCQFLVEVLKVKRLDVSFPHRVGLHSACHGLRGLRLAKSSERQDPPFDHVARLLRMVGGLELTELERSDECCGFGGTFSISEEAVSVRMGRDRVADHLRSGADVITSTDMSCLMHLDGLIRREKLPLRVLHVAEILNGTAVPEAART